jgi:hypothetical protein
VGAVVTMEVGVEVEQVLLAVPAEAQDLKLVELV